MSKLAEKFNQHLNSPLKIFLFFFCIALLLYGNTLVNGFSLDDHYFLNHNGVKNGIKGIGEIFTSNYVNQENYHFSYRPIPFVSFAVENTLFNLNPAIAHFFNIILYGLLLSFIYQILNLITKNEHPLLIGIAIILFAVHPSHTEVVASLKNREIILMVLFGALYIKQSFLYLESKDIKHLVFSFLFMALGILSKESFLFMVAVNFLLLFSLFIIDSKKYFKPSLIISGLSVFTIFIIQLSKKGLLKPSNRELQFFENPMIDSSFSEKIIYALNISYENIYNIFYPVRQLFYYGYDFSNMSSTPSTGKFFILLLTLLTLVYLIYLGLKTKNLIILWSSLSLVSLLILLSNIIKVAPGLIADRFIFIPTLFSSILITYIILYFSNKFQIKPKYLYPIFGLLFLFGTFKTITRNINWDTQYTLMKADINQLRQSAVANEIFGTYLMKEITLNKEFSANYIDTAATYYQYALNVYPDFQFCHKSLAVIYSDYLNEEEKSIQHYEYFTNKNIYESRLIKSQINTYIKINQINKVYELLNKIYSVKLISNREKIEYTMLLINSKQDTGFAFDYLLRLSNEEYINYSDLVFIGDILVKNQKFEAAIIVFDKALKLDQSDQKLIKNIIQYYQSKGDLEKVKQYELYLK